MWGQEWVHEISGRAIGGKGKERRGESKREGKTKEKEKVLERFEAVQMNVYGQFQTNIHFEKEGLVAGKHQSYVKGHFNSA